MNCILYLYIFQNYDTDVSLRILSCWTVHKNWLKGVYFVNEEKTT